MQECNAIYYTAHNKSAMISYILHNTCGLPY